MKPLRSAYLLIIALSLNAPSLVSEVSLSSDFTTPSNKAGVIYDFWNTHNRLPPYEKINIPAFGMEGSSVNCVRMLGGWSKKGERMLDYDCYKWDGDKYVYDWEPLIRRIDVVLNSGIRLKQIVLDNPPWAFQHGITFVEEPDGVNYLASDKNSTYGNAVPPNDPAAWHEFIKAAISKLVETYGEEQVASWRFRVGSEIDTRPGHWIGTRQQYFDHYKNTIDAVHAVLPKAKVGAQFREASFTGKKDYIDYKGNVEGSYARAFIEWAKKNGIRYDFIGTSYYPFYDKEDSVDMDIVYREQIEPIQHHPDWRPGALFEIHEFWGLSQFRNGEFVWLSNSYSSSLFASISKMVLENDIKQVHLWGNIRDGLVEPNVLTQKALRSMQGMDRYTNTTSGSPSIEGNMINGIFARSAESENYDALIFNYNKKSMDYQEDEAVQTVFKVNTPPNTQYSFRVATYGKDECAFQQFAVDFPKATKHESDGGWIKDSYDTNGTPYIMLVKEGVDTFVENTYRYTHLNDLQWSEWETTASEYSDDEGSLIRIQTQLPSFAFQKIEVRSISNKNSR
ncbi:GH39 family glycosyl hydrolase [Pelagicoccus mobilis]|uniref:Glycosyl hydrolases family 39 N-terminal catalytic domain-containing protein n=1 Tax=Pelagicoccus mobilis TaxID=415221 RepID=A0A934RZX1_9BACT|nr:hypothetical protein [Pelagicoccus mobilis]MBK1879373.1 hypothetical protein [Pelagicoccus mobilis]